MGLKESIKAKRNAARIERLRGGITKDMHGLEIGPSLRPVVPKREGYLVEIVDHLSREELTAKYAAMGLDTSAIEEVDHIWDGRSYCELTGKQDYYDYIVASHVIEHTPDFIAFLKDCSAMLKDGGILSLAVPDKRYTLDHFRTVTTVAEVIDQYLHRDSLGTVGTLCEYALHVCRRGGRTAWAKELDALLPKRYENVHDLAFARRLYHDATTHPEFHDIHQHIFTPSSFRLLIAELRELELIDLGISAFHPTVSSEFVVQLKKQQPFTPLGDAERRALLRKISRENRIR